MLNVRWSVSTGGKHERTAGVIQSAGAMTLKRIESGTIPIHEKTTVWVGYGKGRACDGCGETIGQTVVEYEADVPESTRILRFHLECYTVWQQQCEKLLA
jgi:hypothetical protein